MVNRLQDQLLKAGLVKADQLRKVAKEKRHTQRSKAPDVAAEQARLALQQKAEADRSRSRKQEAERDRKARAAQIQQLIETRRLSRRDGNSVFQFVDGGKIKKIAVREAQRNQLATGVLAVVILNEVYELVPAETAEKIAQRDPGRVIVLNTRTSNAKTEAGSDPYADYPVPDDLTW